MQSKYRFSLPLALALLSFSLLLGAVVVAAVRSSASSSSFIDEFNAFDWSTTSRCAGKVGSTGPT